MWALPGFRHRATHLSLAAFPLHTGNGQIWFPLQMENVDMHFVCTGKNDKKMLIQKMFCCIKDDISCERKTMLKIKDLEFSYHFEEYLFSSVVAKLTCVI